MTEEQRLIQAVDEFAEAMKNRLISKLNKGYTGWDDPTNKNGILSDIENDVWNVIGGYHVKKHCVDAANRLMMIWKMGAKP